MSKAKLSPGAPAERNSLCRWRGPVAFHAVRDRLGRLLLVPLCVGCFLCSASAILHDLGEFPYCSFSHPLLDK